MLRKAVFVTLVGALTTCTGPHDSPEGGHAVVVEIAPLTLTDIADVCWDLRITNGPGGSGDIVVARGDRDLTAPEDVHALCSTRFGNNGALTYVAPCDAASNQDNSVTLWLDSLWEVGADTPSTTHKDPCPTGCTLDVTCRSNADARVVFDLIVMRDARQGFFDVAVNFSDIFCSAKFDTCTDDVPPVPTRLLFGPHGDRIETGVLAFACTAGPGSTAETHIHLGAVTVTCEGSADITLDLGQVENPGNQPSIGGVLWAAYFGSAPVASDDTHQTLAWFNVAIAPTGDDCVVSWQATASADPAVGSDIAPGDGVFTAYPVVHTLEGPLTEDGEWVCGRHALDMPGSVVRTTYHYTRGGARLDELLGPGATSWLGGVRVSGDSEGDTTPPAMTAMTVPAFGNYVTGDTLTFTVTFTEPVYAAALRLPLTLDARTGLAAPTNTTWPATTVTFVYTVGAQDFAADGIELPTAFTGTYTDAAGNTGDTAVVATPNVEGIRVNDVPLALLAFTPPANDWYMEGDELIFRVTYNRAVEVDDSNNSPSINFRLGVGTGTLRQATYQDGAEVGVLRFVYELLDGDDDPDGINMATATITLNGATITDSKPVDEDQTAPNAPLTFTMPTLSGIKVDTVAPTLGAITRPANATYTLGQILRTTLAFSEPVTVTGTPTLELLIGSTVVQAPLVSGNGTAALVFEYAVAAGVTALVDEGPVELVDLHTEGVTIQDLAGHDADLTSFLPAIWTSVYVDGLAPPSILSVIGPDDGDYLTGDSLFFTVAFSEPVTIVPYTPTANAPATRPALQLNIGGQTRYATLIDEGPSDVHVFEYPLDTGDQAPSGISVSSPLLIQNASYPIRSEDYVDKEAVRTFSPPDLTGVRVINQPPTGPVPLTWLKVPTDRYYRAGRVLSFTAYFDKAVTLSATGSTRPRIAVKIGDTIRYAESHYLSGRRSSLLMRFTVQADEEDHDGIEILSDCIDLNGGTLTAPGGATVDLCFTAPDTAGIKIDGRPAQLLEIIPPPDGPVLLNQNLTFYARFSEPVKVSYTPRLRIDIRTGASSTIRSARYVGGTNTDTLRFDYKVTTSDEDLDGVKLALTGTPATPLTLSTNTRIRDLGGNNAVRTYTTADHHVGVIVDGKPPTVTSVARAPTGTIYLRPDEHADLLVNYGEAVIVNGTPKIRIVVGTTTRYAEYAPALSTPTQLVFRYTIQPGDRDTNGISIYSPIDLNGGTMRDAAGNAALTKLNAIASMSGLRVGCSNNGAAITRYGYSSLRTYNITRPAGCVSMRFKIWGAGGGGSYSSSGGGGGFVSGRLDVSANPQIQLVLGVRGSGTSSSTSSTRPAGYDGRTGGWGRYHAGRGAGATGFAVGGVPLAIIGGGGGGGMGGHTTTSAVHVARGGASNRHGEQSSLYDSACLAGSARGNTGTLDTGGDGGCAPGGGACGASGTANGLGGNGGDGGAARTGGGGGGGGWTGGGGGAGLCGNGGGGGLTHMVDDPRITQRVIEAGNGRLPGGVNDPNYNASYGGGGLGANSLSGQYSRMVYFWE